MIPSTLLTVEGSARTLIWVDVTPSTGTCAAVGCEGSGAVVSEGAGVWVAGNIEVTMIAVGVNIVSSLRLKTQPVLKKTKTMITMPEERMDTGRF